MDLFSKSRNLPSQSNPVGDLNVQISIGSLSKKYIYFRFKVLKGNSIKCHNYILVSMNVKQIN